MKSVGAEEPSVMVTAPTARDRLPHENLEWYFGISGPFQRHVFYFVLLVFFVSSLHTFLMPVFARDVDYWCEKPPEFNMSNEQWFEKEIPRNPDGSPDRCHLYLPTGAKVQCNSWVYNTSDHVRTFREEFDLVCQREWMLGLIYAIFFIGCLNSDFVSGTAADLLGRQPVILVSVFTLLCSGFAILVIQYQFVNFLAWRFFVAFGLESACNIGLIALIEVTYHRNRSVVIMSALTVWGVGYMSVLPLLAYLDDWLVVQYFIMIPTVLLVVGIEVVLESPRWLLAVQDFKAAKALIIFAALKNHLDVTEVNRRWKMRMDESIKDTPAPALFESWVDAENPHLFSTISILCFSWLLNAFLFYSLMLSFGGSGTEPRNLFSSEFPNLLAQLAAFVLGVMTVDRYGRKWSSAAFMLTAGLVSLPAMLFSEADFPDLFMMFRLAATILVTAANSVLNLRTLEIIPTLIRGRGFSACAIFGRLGSILAAFRVNLPKSWRQALYMLFGTLCAVSSALQLRLPETIGQELPDYIEDLDDFLELPQSTRKSTASKYETCAAYSSSKHATRFQFN